MLNDDQYKPVSKAVSFFLGIWILWILFVIGCIGTLAYVAVHFISKFW